MNDSTLDDLKKYSITAYIESLGFKKDARRSNKNFSFFKSIFRNEKTASLSINENKNVFFDYGIGQGGDIIRLIQMYKHLSFKDAINELKSSTLPIINVSERKNTKQLEITDIKYLENEYLINYLHLKRGINYNLCFDYISEIHFIIDGCKPQYAIGFKNDLGGFELRNKYYKGCTRPKGITTINPNAKSKKLSIFEGFMDFLSAITYYKIVPTETVIVLNSVSFMNSIEFDKYEVIKFWGDNDEAGNRCFKEIPKNKAKDMRGIYANHKDFNDFLLSTFKAKK